MNRRIIISLLDSVRVNVPYTLKWLGGNQINSVAERNDVGTGLSWFVITHPEVTMSDRNHTDKANHVLIALRALYVIIIYVCPRINKGFVKIVLTEEWERMEDNKQRMKL